MELETNPLKRAIVDDHAKQVGRHDQPKIFGGPVGDPGLTGPGSMSWEINSDVSAIAIGGVSAIIMEILHPSVMAGVQDLSSYREQPFRRAQTTYGYVVTTTFGNTKAATDLIDRVHRMHSRVNGTRPDGVPYRALDPELIGWVHTCIPWAVMTAYDRYNRPLSDEEKSRYLAEQAVIGRMGGAGEIPETAADLVTYVEEMRPKLEVTESDARVLRVSFDLAIRDPRAGAARASLQPLPDRFRDEPDARLGSRALRLRLLGACRPNASAADASELRANAALGLRDAAVPGAGGGACHGLGR